MEINEFKVVFLGDSGIGAKTSLFNRIVHNTFDVNVCATYGTSFSSTTIQTQLGTIKLELWDTAGQEIYRPFTAPIIIGAHCIILGYDVTLKYSFESIRDFWYNFLKKNIDINNVLIYLVGNKIDLYEMSKVSDEEGKSLANDLNMKFFEVSAETGKGVDILLEDICDSLINKFIKKIIDTKKSKKEDKSNKIKLALGDYLNY